MLWDLCAAFLVSGTCPRSSPSDWMKFSRSFGPRRFWCRRCSCQDQRARRPFAQGRHCRLPPCRVRESQSRSWARRASTLPREWRPRPWFHRRRREPLGCRGRRSFACLADWPENKWLFEYIWGFVNNELYPLGEKICLRGRTSRR